jgi:hypothetical protein
MWQDNAGSPGSGGASPYQNRISRSPRRHPPEVSLPNGHGMPPLKRLKKTVGDGIMWRGRGGKPRFGRSLGRSLTLPGASTKVRQRSEIRVV